MNLQLEIRPHTAVTINFLNHSGQLIQSSTVHNDTPSSTYYQSNIPVNSHDIKIEQRAL